MTAECVDWECSLHTPVVNWPIDEQECTAPAEGGAVTVTVNMWWDRPAVGGSHSTCE